MKYILSFCFLFFWLVSECHPKSVRVKRVVDGDTFICAWNSTIHTCRITNIDAPELNQHFGAQSYQQLCNLLYGKKIILDSLGIDKYKRVLVFVSLGGRRLDSLLVRQGYAWHYVNYSKDPVLVAAMTRAQVKFLGLWSCGIEHVCPPWLYRSYNFRNRWRFCNGC